LLAASCTSPLEKVRRDGIPGSHDEGSIDIAFLRLSSSVVSCAQLGRRCPKRRVECRFSLDRVYSLCFSLFGRFLLLFGRGPWPALAGNIFHFIAVGRIYAPRGRVFRESDEVSAKNITFWSRKFPSALPRPLPEIVRLFNHNGKGSVGFWFGHPRYAETFPF